MLHNKVLESYLKHLTLRDGMTPPSTLDIAHACIQLQNDIKMHKKIWDTNPWTSIPKDGSIHLAWEYAKDPAHHHLFVQMMQVLHMSLLWSFSWSKTMMYSETTPTYLNHQLISSWRWLSFGWDILGMLHPWLFTDHCFTAIECLHDIFVRPLTADEKEVEKQWMDAHMGFEGSWCEGWVMYDGTIIVLYAHPGLDGDAYYTWKSNYGLNLQVSLSLCEKSHYW